jgi:hypothetical protein
MFQFFLSCRMRDEMPARILVAEKRNHGIGELFCVLDIGQMRGGQPDVTRASDPVMCGRPPGLQGLMCGGGISMGCGHVSPACLRGTMTAGPDDVRVPGPNQTSGL